MRILVTGATGFLGHNIVKKLLNQGHTVFGVTHSNKETIVKDLFYITKDFNTATSIDSWMLDLEDIDVVINTVGILAESRNNKFINVHTKTPIALFEAAKACHVKKIIHISALGADKNTKTNYQRTKLATEEYVQNITDVDWVILRPSWMFGFDGEGTQFFAALANFPVLGLPYQGSVLMQPVYVKDVAEVITQIATTHNTESNKIYEIGGPEDNSFREIMLKLRSYSGIKNQLSITPPFSLLKFATKTISKISPNSFLGTSLPQLAHDNITEDSTIWQQTQIKPQSLSDVLALNPITQNFKTRVKLLFLQPILRLALALFWLIAGAGGLIDQALYNHSAELITDFNLFSDFPHFYNTLVLYTEIFIAISLIFKFKLKLVRYLQVILLILLSLFPPYFTHIFINIILILAALIATV